MKLKDLLLVISFLVTISLYGQKEEKRVLETTGAVTEFHLKTNNIEELESFDWSRVSDLFKTNDDEQIIKLVFEYDNQSKKRKSKPNIKNLKFEVSGTTQELPELIEKSKKMVSRFLEINESYN